MTTVEVRVPDIGDFSEVAVIELLAKPGDSVQVDQSLITVESDKASMEIPSSSAGVLERFTIALGDKVSEGSTIALLRVASAQDRTAPSSLEEPPLATAGQTRAQSPEPPLATVGQTRAQYPEPPALARPPTGEFLPVPAKSQAESPSTPAAEHRPEPAAVLAKPHASPSVRKFARELGVDLQAVSGSGPKGRITQADVQAHVKSRLQGAASSASVNAGQALGQGTGPASTPAAGTGLSLLAWPRVDFSKFGDIERKPLSRIKKISGANLHRNWVMIPHVTQHDEADISALEALRVELNQEQPKGGAKLTMLAFLIKAVVHTLGRFPEFNASLDGEDLILKKYAHIGFAADTPNGLVVPVLRDADRKGVFEIASETAELAAKARDGKLSPAEMQGGSMSISSLGGIGGSFFTPIINAPEVAILGVGRSVKRPVWDEGGERFVPRLMLPLSLSYDHRVIDGAAAARFTTHLGRLLSDFRRVAL